ncbi:hypothetical protein DFH28DRAFT_958977 [Melampsora americana]|nr:hypothetical protein DFH28DRAFT_958977 [Melampsora americana]
MSKIYLYQGHRLESFVLKECDEALMEEWRARQQTFDGGYLGTSLACSMYALVILRLFSKKFDKIGLLYALLSLALAFISHLRRKRLDHDLSDTYISETVDDEYQECQKIWGREFRTAGDVVMVLSSIILAMQIFSIIIVLQM